MCTKQYLTVYKFLYLFPGLQTPVLPIFEAVLKNYPILDTRTNLMPFMKIKTAF